MIAVADLLQMLLETTAAVSAATLLVLALRRWLRAAFGASIAYAAWALVPVAIIAVLLPAATRPVLAVPMVQVFAAAPLAMTTSHAVAFDVRVSLCIAWMAGTLLTALWFARQQRGFRRRLGALHLRADGLQQADTVAGLPAAIGLWKPAIVLPADFDMRYSGEQRALMLAHEHMHIARGDLHANALTAGLRCVFWFNPLLHVAARHFRHDQELACDLRVIARHPHARRAYGEAMFKTQLALQPLPLGCHWGGTSTRNSHPLKERIAMLKQPVPSLSRWLGGSVVVVALTLAAGVAAWAAQPSRPAVHAAMPAPPAEPVTPVTPALPAPPAPPPTPAKPPLLPTMPAPPTPPPPPMHASDPMPPPPYPQQALNQGLDGTVMLLIDVDADGKPTAVQVEHSEPPGVFDAAAVDAAKHWTFKPERKHGKPVAGRVRMPITFEAPKKSAPGKS